MNQTTYRKTVRLRAETLEQARPMRAALDEQVFQAVSRLTNHEPQLQVTRSADERGNCSILATGHGYDMAIATRSGRDSVFQGGARQDFISYTVSASSRVKSLDRAATISQELTLALRLGGGLLFGAGFFFLLFFGLGQVHVHHVRLPIFVIVAIVSAGAWVGERIGNIIGDKLQSGATALAERSGALPQLDALWSNLEAQFNSLLRGSEVA